MRLRLVAIASSIHIYVVACKYRQGTVRVYGNQEKAGVCLKRRLVVQLVVGSLDTYVYQICLVPYMQVVYDRSLVQMGELGHVIGFIKFSRVDLIHTLSFNLSLLQ